MQKYILVLIIGAGFMFHSCRKVNNADKFSLQSADTYLNFPIDEDTRLPKFCLWTFEEKGKEYLAFPNMGKEILFYDINMGQLVKKVKYESEGANGVGHIYSFSVTDFNHIYIADIHRTLFYITDSTGVIKSKIEYEQTHDGIPLIPAFFHTITYSPMYIWGDSLYFPQEVNLQISTNKGPLGGVINTSTGKITAVPLKHFSLNGIAESSYPTGGGKVSTCFDGKSFIYSYDLLDSIYKLSKDFSKIEKHVAKSKYIKRPKVEIIPNADINTLLKRKCELPGYGNLIYDKYRNVYYRFVFMEAEFDNEKDYMDIYHNGRKQFSIMILDENMNVVGETVFPEYTYNAHLLFVRKDGLYISISHFKRPDFDENVLRFQKIELIEL